MELNRYISGDRRSLRELKRLYKSAFPKEERKPFGMIEKMNADGRADMLKIEDGGKFIGLAFTVKHENIVLLDYFAIKKKERGRGYGTAALERIKKEYSKGRIIIEIEDPDEKCKNKDERIRRLEFYKSCGMELNPYKITLFGVNMVMLSYGGEVSFAEYKDLYYSIVPKNVVDKNVLLRKDEA